MLCLSPNTRADRTYDTGPTHAAIPGRIFVQILLMVVLGKIKRRGRQNFCGDVAVAR